MLAIKLQLLTKAEAAPETLKTNQTVKKVKREFAVYRLSGPWENMHSVDRLAYNIDKMIRNKNALTRRRVGAFTKTK